MLTQRGISISDESRLPPKVRAFIVDKDSGRPLSGIVTALVAEPDDKIYLPLGMLVSDAAGYVSFDLETLRELHVSRPKHLWLYATGDETSRIDVRLDHRGETATAGTEAARSGAPNPSPKFCFPFLLKVNAKLAAAQGGSSIKLPSIQNPDPCDWELSPYSFAIKNDLTLGEAGCEVPVPSMEAEREYRFSQVVRTATPGPSRDVVYTAGRNLGESGAGASSLRIAPVDPTAMPIPATMPIMQGEVLEFRQTWIPKNHSLGTILYSVALAPCESVNIAVIDWSREDAITRTDTILSKENLKHKQKRERTIDETVDAALNELQGGDSFMAGHGGAAAATVPIAGVPVHFGGTHAIGWSASKSWGHRDLTAESGQELHDTIVQQTNVTRSLNSTVVIQATQEERNYLETRTIANHNHCHALTIQYYEVLRHFKVVTEYIRSRRAVLVPYAILDFHARPDLVLRYRTILETILLDPKLLPCFDAYLRLSTGKGYGSSVDAGEGNQTVNEETPSSESTIDAYYLTLESTLKPEGWADPEGWIVVKLKVGNDWKTLYEKKKKDDGGGTLRRPKHDEVVTTGNLIGARPSDIKQVKVEWFENGGSGTGDFWDFKGIRLDYTLNGKAGRKKLIDEQGSSKPSKSKSGEHALKWFDDSNGQWQEWVGTVTATAPVDLKDVDEPIKDVKVTAQPTKAGDEYCYQRLIIHINNNIGYYNSAIWLLQDPSERVMMLNAALAAYPELLDSIDTTPMAVSGNYVAFPYNSEPTKEEGQKENKRLEKNPLRESIVSLPTRGVFAETHLSHCNACEVRDVTRFWKWEESPCEKPPPIEGITPGPRGQTPTIQPTTLPSPVVQIMQPPAAPDPVGLAAALNLLGQPNIFREMSGLKELQDLLAGLASGAVDLAKGQQQLQALKEKLEAQQEMAKLGRQSGSGSGSFQQQTPEDRYDNLQVAKEVANAAPELGWDEKKTSDVTSDIVSGGGRGGPLGILDLILGATPKSVTTRIEFKGVFQCRLATDPDPSDHKRGDKGWTFAHTGEPDLDRLIRFNNPVAPRECIDKVGVKVSDILVNGKSVKDALIDQPVNLGTKTFFDGAAGPPGAEPLANFELSIGDKSTFLKSTSTIVPIGGGAEILDATKLGVFGVDSESNFLAWVARRKMCLTTASASATGDRKKALLERIAKLDYFVPPISIRWNALTFVVKYVGTLDSSLVLTPGKTSNVIQDLKDRSTKSISFEMRFFSFDADGLIGRVEGYLQAK